MAAPSIASGITQLDLSAGNSWTSVQVADAGAAVTAADLTNAFSDGIDPANSAQLIENTVAPTTIGVVNSALSPSWTAVDISGANQAIFMHVAGNPASFNRVDTMFAYAFDSGANRATDYIKWALGDATDDYFKGAPVYFPISLFDTDGTGNGSIDNTDLIEIGFGYAPTDTGTFGVDIRISQIVHVDGEVEFADGDGTTPATFKEYFDLLFPESGETFHSKLTEDLPPAYGFGVPVRINSEEFSDNSFSFIFLPSNASAQFKVPTTGYYSLTIDPDSASATHEYIDGVFAYSTGTYPLVIDGATATSVDFIRCSFLNTSTVVISGANATLANCTISSPTSVDLADALITSMTINDCAAPAVISADLTANSSVTITNPQAESLQFDINPDNYGDLDFIVPASTVNMNPTTTGTYTLTGIQSAGTVTFDNLSANNITISIATELTAVVFGGGTTTGGGTITLVAPTVTIDVTAANLIDDTRVRLYNVTQATEIENVVVSGGAGYTVTLTRGTEYNNSDSLTLLATYQQAGVAKEVFRGTGVGTTTDIIFTDSQVNWDNPNVLALDGSTFTEFVTDYIGVEVEVTDSDNITEKSRIAAFMVDAITTADGIRNWVGLDGTPVIDYPTAASATVDTAVASVTVLNIKAASSLDVTDTFEFDWSDGLTRVSAILGSSIIWVEPARVLTISTGSVLTAGEKTELTAASQASTVNTKIGTPVVTVSDDIAGVQSTITGIGTRRSCG